MKLKSALVWDNTDIADCPDWTYELTAPDPNEVENSLQHFQSLNELLGHFTQETFSSPKLHDKLRGISHEMF